MSSGCQKAVVKRMSDVKWMAAGSCLMDAGLQMSDEFQRGNVKRMSVGDKINVRRFTVK